MNNCYNPFSLEGKTILVTGASSGIGKATAIECSRMGGKMIITGRNEERLNQTLSQLDGYEHRAIVADLVNPEDIKMLVKSIAKLDGAVFCAGINETIPTPFCTPKKFERIFQTNFFSTVELIRLLQKAKVFVNGGSIVLISSVGGNFGIDYGNGIYGASKAALSTWMKFLAQEYANKKIRVNAICPAMVNTPLTAPGAISSEQLKEEAERYPLKRFGEPEEIAYAGIYLLSDASSWVTGINLVIDGGSTI